MALLRVRCVWATRNLLKGVPGDRGAAKTTTHAFRIAFFLRDSILEAIEISNLLVSARESFLLFQLALFKPCQCMLLYSGLHKALLPFPLWAELYS